MLASFNEFKKAGTDLMGAASTSFQRGIKVAEVTSTKDDSLPVYALNELVQASSRDAEEAKQIAVALLRKVSSSNPTVKWKALKSIRYICQNATSSVFKRACGGVAAGPIRQAQTFTGPPHPQLGNSLNLRVRDAAKEALEEVFKLGAPPAPAAAPAQGGGGPDLKGRIQGYGSTTGARIQSSYGAASGGGGQGGGGGGAGKYGGFGSEDVRRAEEAGGSWMAAAQGGGRGGEDDAGFTALASEPPSAATQGNTNGARGGEQAAVEQLCSGATGLRPQPTPAQLKTFLRAAAPLDSDTLVMELSQKLVNTTWQTRVRALAGIQAAAEAVQASGGEHALALVVASLASMPETFDSVLTHAHPAVRQAALQCAAALGFPTGGAADAAGGGGADAMGDLLGGGGGGDAGAPDDAPVLADGDPLGDLLGGASEPVQSSAAPAAPAPVQQQSAPPVDLLGGLGDPAPAPNGTTGAAAVPPAAPADMFAGLSLASSPPAASQADPLAGLTSATPAAPPPASDPMAELAKATSTDPLAGLSMPPVAPQPAAQPDLMGAAPASAVLQPAMNGASAPAWPEPAPSVGPGVAAQPQPGVGGPALPFGFGMAPMAPNGLGGGMGGASGMQGVSSMGSGGLGASGSRGATMQSHAKPKDAFDFVNDQLKR